MGSRCEPWPETGFAEIWRHGDTDQKRNSGSRWFNFRLPGVLDILDPRAFPFMRFSRGRTGLTRQIGLVPVDYPAVICPSQPYRVVG